LAQEEVAAPAQLKRRIARDGRIRLDQIGWIEQAAAAVALVTAGIWRTAMRADAENISIRQKSAVARRPDLLDFALFDEPGGVETPIEMLCERVILRRRGSTKVIERQPEPAINACLSNMLSEAKFSNRQVRGRSGKFGRRAMLISPANEEDLIPKLPTKPGMNIRGKQRTDEVTEVLDAIYVWNGAGD
jgi:hypothetical protein